ncbi:L-lactate dehydrogenase [Duganella sp. FT50W]|uniref:L-lactate dehydrogenase n=1 Tax=Duganella lactea TaxID=2692173 RepID=A0A6L8MS92_9BURK|nr:alpha-hydroxy acid oxidase [Duganella lactea]MYM84905.1 L-lactate dehydrogenase [Duganella lactea]
MSALSHISCVEDLRRMARGRVPRMFYDYVDAGSWSESTYRDNELALARLKFQARVAVDVQQRSTRSSMLGQEVTMPVALAPVGLAGMIWADGEMLAARAAKRFGVPFSLSTMSICSLEDVAAHIRHPFWFQLYMMRDREFVARLIERARAAECSALILTLDLAVPARRHKDIRNGLTVPLSPTVRNLVHLASRPRWCMDMLRTPRRTFGNIIGHANDVNDLKSFWKWSAGQFDQTVSWADVEWVKRLWGGKLIVKGIMNAEDAVLAVRSGADAVVVSNHGGRQLDGAAASIEVLPEVVQAVGQSVEVHLDSGVRSGQDVLRACALGAKGVYVGRPILYGLGASGEQGVSRTLELLQDELDLTMALCGLRGVEEAGMHILRGR